MRVRVGVRSSQCYFYIISNIHVWFILYLSFGLFLAQKYIYARKCIL